MPALTASQALPLQLEAWSPYIADCVEVDAELSRYLGNGNGGATRVSQRLFRARLKTAKSGNMAFIDLDRGSLPPGNGNKWDQMLLSPEAWCIPIQYSQLAQLMEGQGVATDNAVTDTIADVVTQCATFRDILLQTSGDGSLGSVDSVNGNYIVFRSPSTTVIDGRGAHLVREQQTVQIMSAAYVLKGSCTISQVFKPLGGVQQVLVDAVPAGTGAGDLVICSGLPAGAPQGINGIPYFVSTSTAGNLYGISRAVPYVVANGFTLNNLAQVSKPVFRVLQNQIIQRLGKKGLKDQFFHTHPSQLQAVEELGFADTFVPLSNGKARAYDPMFEEITISGRPIYANIHADQTRWDLLLKSAWATIRWGAGMFWFKNKAGQMVFQVVDTNSGMPTVQEYSAYVVAEQYYVSNALSQGAIVGAKVPTAN